MRTMGAQREWVMQMVKSYRGRYRLFLISGVTLLLLVLYYFSLPEKLFRDPYSTVLEAHDGALLAASIASDGQWRFPESDSLPSKFVQALTTYEDKRFYSHPGVDPLSLGRAINQNIRSGKIVSGGSTISMQVIRLSRKGNARTITEKILEAILATRLEIRFTKDEILRLYASHAPFGGNVVGLEAACWRYYGRSSESLSWGEASLLAVLPNSPALIHPGRNRDRLRKKRDALLDRLYQNQVIDSITCFLAKEEDLPEEPLPLPRFARHLLDRLNKTGYAQKRIRSTVDFHLQQRMEQILMDHHQRLSGNKIHNAAALVARVSTGEVMAYVGNVSTKTKYHGSEVDIITAPRSTGSILKPFLYAAMLDEGKILPRTLLDDIPVLINGFSPKNFNQQYDGVVPANQALIRSLNIPAVNLLREYRYEKFHSLLKAMGMKTLHQPADHYGLSLILGGAEGTLWDICGMYASMSRTLNHFFQHPGQNKYSKSDFHNLTYLFENRKVVSSSEASSWLSAASIYQTFDALKELYRPDEESGWRHFSSSKQIAWKTGTSFGFRDGWAVGVTPEYVVGVWVGNADGEGRPGLTGTDGAAPILFDLFAQLDGYTWFKKPFSEMKKITVCAKSGYRNTALCNAVDTVWISEAGLETSACPYHQRVYLSNNLKYRVHSACEDIRAMRETSWFVLPPVQEYYYRDQNLSYQSLPPYRKDCSQGENLPAMDLIYPKPNAKIYIPRDITGTPGHAIFQLAHRDPAITVFWHLDNGFIGSTRSRHQMPLNPPPGKHTLTIMDETGFSITHSFEVLSDL